MGQSRTEDILENILGADNELEAPQSRVEVLLMRILEGGGTVPEASTTTSGTVKIDGTSIVMTDGVISVGYSNADNTSY